MNVLTATSISGSMLVSSNAPLRLSGQTEWTQKSYSAGETVTRLTDVNGQALNRVYRAAYSVPEGTPAPEENIATAQFPRWVDRGPMNQWGMFDGVIGTRTLAEEDLVVRLRPGVVTAVWAGGITGVTEVHVVLRDAPGGSIVYDRVERLVTRTTNYWDWWFAPFTYRTDVMFEGIPAYRDGEVEVTFVSSGDVGVGMLALGNIENWGKTEWGVDADFNNYSSRSLNSTWGPSQATEGEVTKDITYRVFVEPEDAPRVDELAKDAMKRPAIFIPSGKPEFAGIRVFGQAISLRMGYPYPEHVPLDITVREFL